jgi:Flp pilus assembly protein TadG
VRTRHRRDESGVTTVEFALVFPLFIALIGIAFFFSWMFYVQAQVDRAADRAARYAAVPYTATTTVQQNVDQNGNLHAPGATLAVGLSIVNGYTTTQTTTAYNFCVPKVLTKVNSDLTSDTIAAGDLVVSDGSGVLTGTAACAKPNGYVKVQVTKDFTNPFSAFLSPFTGTTNTISVTGTGRARVEAK